MRKYKEGQRKLREAKRKRKAGQDDARDPASCYQVVAVEIVQMKSIIGGLSTR